MRQSWLRSQSFIWGGRVAKTRELAWTDHEVVEIVRDYFAMLQKEVEGVSFSKTEHRNTLIEKLNNRSAGSIEMKHQNISAVLNELGLPWIYGYKPAKNAQRLLRDVVTEYAHSHSETVERVLDRLERVAPARIAATSKTIFQAPPIPIISQGPPSKRRIPRKYNYAERDDLNRKLGRAGESFVCDLERLRLTEESRPDLATNVKWVADEIGDGTGYDVHSYRADRSDLFIEVKTTNCKIPSTPFLISSNELSYSDENPKTFALYRVYDFSANPLVYVIEGSLSKRLKLEATTFKAWPQTFE